MPMISQDPWKIRQDPSTATPVASTNPTTITSPGPQGGSPGKAALKHEPKIERGRTVTGETP